jgi:hypothetical protein
MSVAFVEDIHIISALIRCTVPVHHLKRRLAGRRRRIEPLLVQHEVDPAEFGQEADQVLQRASQPVDRPCHDQIELAARGILA